MAFTYQGEALGKRVKPLAESIGSKLVIPCDVEDVGTVDAAFAAIDDTVAAVDAPTAMLDLAAGLGPFDHPFGPELNRQEVATELLRAASDSRDPGAEIAHAVEGYDASPISRPAHAAVAPESGYVAALRTKDAQISALEADLAKDRRHLRALEHALATESGPRAKRAYFVMTAPTKRLVEAVRRRR